MDESDKKLPMALSERQAYEAMIRFLTRFHLPRFDQIGVVLGELEFRADGQTGDPAAWSDWMRCVTEELAEGGDYLRRTDDGK